MLNFLDRQIIAILLESIKQDLGATDTEMGLLSGLAFAIFYVTAGIPLARIADTGVRRSLIAGCLCVWSLMTALSGLAQSFMQLALARIGVAAGESGAQPAMQSMIADMYPPAERGGAVGLVNGAQTIGIGLGLFLGGWLNHFFGWRAVFLIVGLPGVILAIVIRLTVPEPTRGGQELVATKARKEPLRKVIRRIWDTPSARAVILGIGFSSMTGYALFAWMPSFLIRVHGLDTTTVGLIVGVSIAVGQPIANIGSGFIADRLGRRDMRWYAWISVIGAFAAILPVVGCVTLENTALAVVCFFLFNVATGSIHAPGYALMMALVPSDNRATSAFMAQLSQNLLGIAVGPFMVGILSDLFRPAFGAAGLGFALISSTIGVIVGGLLFLHLARILRNDLREI